MSEFTLDPKWEELYCTLLGQTSLSDEQIEQLLAEQFLSHSVVAKSTIELPEETQRGITFMYSNWGKRPASVDKISTTYGIPVEWVKRFIREKGLTHDSPPYSKEQAIGLDETELQNIVIARKNAAVKLKTEAAVNRQIISDAKKWQTFRAGVLEELQNWQPTVRVSKTLSRKTLPQGGAVVVGLTDNHFGAFADELTTGDTVTKETVWADVMSAVSNLISRLRTRPDVMYVPVGSDWWHVDGVSRTTQKGTPQSMHGSGASILKEGTELLIAVVESLRPHCGRVILVPMAGNHDRTSAHAGLMVLEAYYRNDSDVEVHPSRLSRCYLKYKGVLLGFTHGDLTKPMKSAQLASTEARKMWGDSECRVMFGGHEHHLEAIDCGGITYYKLPSLAKTDEWHHASGYTDANKCMMAFYFSENRLEETYYVYPD